MGENLFITSDHTITGGCAYWIRCCGNGVYNVRRECGDESLDNETVYTGTYTECKAYLQHVLEENADYDLNIQNDKSNLTIPKQCEVDHGGTVQER